MGFGLFLIMLAAGATYQNNLVFMMAFFAISLGLVAILQTARNLRDIEPLALHVESSFASNQTSALLSLINKTADPKINLEIKADFRHDRQPKVQSQIEFFVSSLETQSTNSYSSLVKLPNLRGRYHLHRLRVSTRAPYGLFRAWIYLELKSDFITYPEAIGERNLPPAPVATGEDFSSHKDYAPGDPMSRIDWKVHSRRKEYFIKQFIEGANPKLEFHLTDTSPVAIESKLSQLTLWLSEAHSKNFDFRLETKSFNSPFGHDKSHLHRCLTELALWAA